MNRKIKITSGIYEFLNTSGVLVDGNNNDIERAKKQYWNTVRKEYKKERRKTHKSYTVFFTPAEMKIVYPKAKHFPGGITNYIKQATLSHAGNRFIINKKIIGEIREAVAIHYNSIEKLGDGNVLSTNMANEALLQITIIEKKLLDFLKQV